MLKPINTLRNKSNLYSSTSKRRYDAFSILNMKTLYRANWIMFVHSIPKSFVYILIQLQALFQDYTHIYLDMQNWWHLLRTQTNIVVTTQTWCRRRYIQANFAKWFNWNAYLKYIYIYLDYIIFMYYAANIIPLSAITTEARWAKKCRLWCVVTQLFYLL